MPWRRTEHTHLTSTANRAGPTEHTHLTSTTNRAGPLIKIRAL